MQIAQGWKGRHVALAACASAFVALFSACNDLSCMLAGDNLKGRLTYSDSLSRVPGAPIIIQWSTDNFATIAGSRNWDNWLGLLTFEYSACVDSEIDYQVRAIQDTNGNGQYDSGEVEGRCDGTANGDSAFITKRVPQSNGEKWEVVNGADIVLDTQQ